MIKVEHEPVQELQFFWKWPGKYTGTLLWESCWQCLYLPKLCTKCLATKNGKTRNCSTSLQGYCHGSWCWCLPDIYHCEQGSVHKLLISMSEREVPIT